MKKGAGLGGCDFPWAELEGHASSSAPPPIGTPSGQGEELLGSHDCQKLTRPMARGVIFCTAPRWAPSSDGGIHGKLLTHKHLYINSDCKDSLSVQSHYGGSAQTL